MTPRAAQRELEALAVRMERAGQEAVAATLEDLREAAVRWSSGARTLAELRRMGHPYARAGGAGRGRLDPGQINVQTGAFRRAWRVEGPDVGGGAVVGSLFNTDPKAARFLEFGTRRMVARPIDERVTTEQEGALERHLEAAMTRAFGG